MSEPPLIDIRPDHWEIVRAILKKHVPDREVWAFGSRAKWTAKQYSDLDLCILGDEPLELDVLAGLEEDFSESDLPFKVDVVDWATTAEGFRGIIERDRVVVQSGRIAGGWQKVAIGDVFDVNPARTIRRGQLTPFIPMDALTENARSVLRVEEREFTGTGMKFQNGDTLIARITPCLENGKTAFITGLPDGVIAHGSTEYIVISGKPDKSVGLFSYYIARSQDFRRYAIGHMEGTSGRQRVPSAAVEKYTIDMPPLSEQLAIAQVLGVLDDKIELNRRMNADLEAMARALFKDWFVDFGPVRAKAEGRPAYLAPEIWDLFPDAMDDEDKPVGWISSPLAGIADLNPREKLIKGDPAPYLEMSALPTGGGWPAPPVLRSFEAGSKFRNGDTLLARITPCLENGKTAFVHCLEDGQVGWGSTEFIVIRPMKPFPEEFGYLLARDPRFRNFVIQSMTGTSGRQRVQVDSLAGYEITAPRTDLLSIFGLFVKPCFAQIKANAEESQTLAQLRDLLLPKLITGEIRVRDAEKAVEEIV